MVNILDEVLKHLPEDANISEALFEGANIVLYTKNKDFLFNTNGVIKSIVDDIKKRVELRPDPSICMELENAKKVIEEIIPKEAAISEIIFDAQRSRVIIEAEKPGIAIGKQGELLKEIKKKTLWIPLIKRTPAIRSKLIENIRHVLYENDDFRKKFLHRVGKRIYDGWKRERKNEWVRVTFLGASRQVGRSCFLLQTPESRVLLDCGIDVAASGTNQFPYLDAPELNINDLDAVVITHPHVDHIAFLPYLFKMGYDGPVYATAPTRDIGALLCLDLIGIAHKEAEKPLYSASDIKNMVKHTICLDFEEVSDITPDVRLTFHNAGHNLGSAMAHLHIGNGLHNLLYCGDFNFENSNLLSAAVTKFPRLETVIMEGTYGGKDDIVPSRKESEIYLLDIIKDTVAKKGKILMPVLGVGRSQEVMLIIERAIREGLIPKIPVYIQGMVWEVTAIHTTYPDFFNNRVKRNIFHRDENPFLSDIFKKVGSQEEMKDVIESGESCIVMATSGMLQGGPALEYFRNLAENPKNVLVLTSYQGEGSLGRRLQNGERDINLGYSDKPDMVYVKMEVHIIRGFSGHSSRNALLNWVHQLEPRPKKIIIVHGESSKCLDLASSIHRIHRVETAAPKNLEVIRIK